MASKWNISRFMNELLLDTNGKLSHKRLITFIAFFLVCIAFIANMAFSIPMEDFIFQGMVAIVIGGAGFSTIEHFSLGKFGKNDAKTITPGVENPELLEG